jgi:hypothetical protein
VLGWHPFLRASDLIEEFGIFAKELEVVTRGRGGVPMVDLLTGRGVAASPQICRTVLQSVVYSLNDIFGICAAQAERIEQVCEVRDDDVIVPVKGVDARERVDIHLGPMPPVFDSVCEWQACDIARRSLELYGAMQYARGAGRVLCGEAPMRLVNLCKFVKYIAEEASGERRWPPHGGFPGADTVEAAVRGALRCSHGSFGSHSLPRTAHVAGTTRT